MQQPPRPTSFSYSDFTRLCALIVVTLGVAVLLGWLFDKRWITTLLPGWASMKPTTAISLVMAGISLDLLSSTTGGRRTFAGRLLGGLIGLVGVLTLQSYLTGSVGLTARLRLPTDLLHQLPSAPMSGMSALGFLLAGAALVGLPAARAWTFVTACALALLCIALVAVAGHMYDATALYQVGPFSSLALHTAISFALLGLGLLCARPDRRPVALLASGAVGGQNLRRFLPFAVAAPLALGWIQLVAERRGAYDLEFGTAVLAVSGVIGFVAFLWLQAEWLQRAESRRAALEGQLVQAQKMEAVARLAGGLAHDFNNVLTIVINVAELALAEASDPSVRADLQTIGDAGRSAGQLTRQLLDLGRKQLVQPTVLSLNDELEAAAEMVERLVPSHVTCSFELAEALGAIRIDRGQLEQVLLNLVVNAVDAMPEGGSLTIRSSQAQLDESYTNRHVEVEPGSYVVLAVSDTGVGMDDATVGSIFEPFFTTKARGKGTGLGLSTVHGIVRQSGGNIWVYSEVGHGTTFKVYFPVVEGVAQARTESNATSAKSGGAETVLVVDDDPRVVTVVAETLRRAGYSVRTAHERQEALGAFRAMGGGIDLVLTDVMMPGLGAREFAEAVRASSADVKILFMSGYAEDMDMIQWLLDEGYDIVEKPFNPSSLLERARRTLDGPAPYAGRPSTSP